MGHVCWLEHMFRKKRGKMKAGMWLQKRQIQSGREVPHLPRKMATIFQMKLVVEVRELDDHVSQILYKLRS